MNWKATLALLLTVSIAAADTKITALPAGTGASVGINDIVPFVAVGPGTTKKIKFSEFINVPSLQFLGDSGAGGSAGFCAAPAAGDAAAGKFWAADGSWKVPSSTSGVTSVTGSPPIVSSGGSTPAISMPASTNSVDGYLTGADHTAFAAKQSALTFLDSIQNVAGTVTLVGDSAAPGASKYYGTDGTSTLGFYALPSGATGSVTSVGLSLPVEITVSGSPVTTTGTLTGAWANEASYSVFSGPSGATGTPTFKTIDHNYISDFTSAAEALFSIGTFGSVPNNDGASYASGVITIQPADATHPGAITAGTQTIAGTKTFSSTISGSINGNAATATALAANPTDCAANNYATTIDAGGNLTCSQVSLSAGVTGTLPIGNGGTGQTTNTAAFDALAPATPAKGTLLVYNGTHWINLGVGTDTFVLTSDSAQAAGVKWAAAGGGGTSAPVITTKSASFTASTADDIYPIDTTSGLVTVTVPDATTVGANKVWTFMQAAGNGGFLLVLSGSNTFPDGSNSRSVNGLEASVDLVLKNGSNNVYQK